MKFKMKVLLGVFFTVLSILAFGEGMEESGITPAITWVELENQAPTEIAEELLVRIGDATDGMLDAYDLRALDRLRGSDLEISKILKDEYFAPESGQSIDIVRNRVILKALGYLGTEQAKQAIIEIACTEKREFRNLGILAVRELAEITDNPSEIALVLQSPHIEARNAAAEALMNKLLDRESIDALINQLSSPDWATHNAVSRAFQTDKSTAYVTQKIESLLNNYPKLTERIKDSEPIEPVYLTPLELVRGAYIDALTNMQGGKKELIRRMSNTSGARREALLIALGRRGAASVRPELLQMIAAEKDGFVRQMAVMSLYDIATHDDKDLLRQLAESDPFERFNGKNQTFPVRYAAQGVLDKLSDNAGVETLQIQNLQVCSCRVTIEPVEVPERFLLTFHLEPYHQDKEPVFYMHEGIAGGFGLNVQKIIPYDETVTTLCEPELDDNRGKVIKISSLFRPDHAGYYDLYNEREGRKVLFQQHVFLQGRFPTEEGIYAVTYEHPWQDVEGTNVRFSSNRLLVIVTSSKRSDELNSLFKDNPELKLASYQMKHPTNSEFSDYSRPLGFFDQYIKIGMPYDQVLFLMGSPDSSGNKQWGWDTSPAGGFWIGFEEGKVVSKYFSFDSDSDSGR